MTSCYMFNQICLNCESSEFTYGEIQDADNQEGNSVIERTVICKSCGTEYAMISNVEWMIVSEVCP